MKRFILITLALYLLLSASCAEVKTTPSGWPKDVKIMPGLTIFQSTSDGRIMTVSARGNVTLDAAMSFYYALKTWDTPSGYNDIGGTRGFQLKRGNEKLDVSIYLLHGDNGQLMTHVTLVYTKI